MALYTDPNGLDNEQFANFSFPHTTNDLNQSLPIVDNIISQPAPRSDHAAASEFSTSMTTMADAITKFQADLSVLHALFASERFPSPQVTAAHLTDLQDQLKKMTELAISSGIAALSSNTENANSTLWMNIEGIGHGGEDQNNVNKTFQKMEGMKKSANAVVSVLKKPLAKDA